jgi:hypothetical protein
MIANDLWQKNGGLPQDLPYSDKDADGTPWDRLTDNVAGREACGWSKAPAYPDYDANVQQPVWVDGSWTLMVVPTAPVVPSIRRASQIEVLQRIPQAKRWAILTAAKTDVVIEDIMGLLRATLQVELDDPDLIAGLAYLVSKNLLTTADVAVIRA